MRQLRFVSLAEDAQHLVLESADGLDAFTLPIDPSLRVAVTVDRPARLAATPAPPTPVASDAGLGPREIQVRVRAGASPQEVADETGMTIERVMRFAGPVVEERRRIADEARRARARRTGAEGSEPKVVQFGEAVDERFGAHGIDVATVLWDSRRREDGEWLVVATWLGGDSDHSAEWLFHRGSRSVTPLDDTAADLLSDRPIRPVAPPVPTRPTLAPALAPGVVAFPPMPDAHTGPMPRFEDVFDQEAPSEGPRDLRPFRPGAPRREGAVPAAAASGPVSPTPAPPATGRVETPQTIAAFGVPDEPAALDFEEPPLPLGILDPTTRPGAAAGATPLRTVGRREESEDDKAARARVPSWDDILLGVRRKQD